MNHSFILRQLRSTSKSRTFNAFRGQKRGMVPDLMIKSLLLLITISISPRAAAEEKIPAVTLHPAAHQFVLIGDSHIVSDGTQFQAINEVIERIQPAPEFVCMAGDHIWGWTEDEAVLSEQWKTWSDQNATLLRFPIYHCSANHTVVGPRSAALYGSQFADIPDNGPDGGKKLNYFVRDNDFLLVVVNTAWNPNCEKTGRMGGQRVDTAWLEQVLDENDDAAVKLVMGHHPIHPVDGFDGGWLVEGESGKKMWDLLVQHGVKAYLCAHVIGFDAQVHQGVLQITSGGGGFPYFFGKQDTEYNHCVQLSIDSNRLAYQTLDTHGDFREWLRWPLLSPSVETWDEVTTTQEMPSKEDVILNDPMKSPVVFLRLRGIRNGDPTQTFIEGSDEPYWIGVENEHLCIRLKPIPQKDTTEGVDTLIMPDKSVATLPKNTAPDKMTWTGPSIPEGAFDVQLAIHMGMGPGGMLYRDTEQQAWSSLTTGAWHGIRDAGWPDKWLIENGIRVSCKVDLKGFE